MIYHYSDIKKEMAEIMTVQPPIGWDLLIFLHKDYKNNVIGLTDAAIKIGYALGLREGAQDDISREDGQHR